jgi:hypothetical protein
MEPKTSGFLMGVGVIAVFVGGFLLANYLGNKDSKFDEEKSALTADQPGEEKATVKGKIHFDRLRPEEKDAGEVVLYARKANSDSEFTRLTSGPALAEGAEWLFDKAVNDAS